MNKDSLSKNSEDGIPDILVTIATKLLELLHKRKDLLNLPKLTEVALKKIKYFIIKNKKSG